MIPTTLRFGTAGIPLSTPERNTLKGIAHVKKLGLGAMEIEFVRSVNLTAEKAPLVKEEARTQDVVLTCHGQYYVNLNAKDPVILRASVQRILQACDMAWKAGAWSIVYHMAYYMKDSTEVVFQRVCDQVKQIVTQLKDTGNPIWLRAETGGKVNQFADVDDLVRLSSSVEQVLPCIDWAHQVARSNGVCNSYSAFRTILEKIEKGLGRHALDNMHMHIEGIEYNNKGERYHKNLEDSDFNYRELMKLWKDFKIKGVALSESPNIEEDALRARDVYDKS